MKKDKATPKRTSGRPKGSGNRDKTQVELTPELKRIQEMVKNQLIGLQARKGFSIKGFGYFLGSPFSKSKI